MEADSVSVSESKVVLEVGEVYFNEATILPKNATVKSCSYTSSNPDVVRVDVFGMITAVNNGEAEITVTTNDGKADTKYIVMVKGGEESENPEGDTKDETSGSDDEDSGGSETGDNSGGSTEEGSGESDNTEGNTEDTNSGETESDESPEDSDSDTEKESEKDSGKETGVTEGESVSDNEIKSICVSFDANGGILESETDAKQVHIGESYGILPTAGRENYHFLGWYTDKAKGEGDLQRKSYLICQMGDYYLYHNI